jgi:hypothetical protein
VDKFFVCDWKVILAVAHEVVKYLFDRNNRLSPGG